MRMANLLFCGLFLIFFLVRQVLTPPFSFPLFLLLFITASLIYGISVGKFFSKKNIITPLYVILTGLILRCLLITTDPILSNDVHRYIWDGNLLLHGLNPLEFAPLDPKVAFLKEAIPIPSDHQNIPSIYPPLAQAIFFLVSFFTNQAWGFSIFFIFCEVLTMLFLCLALRRQNLPIGRALIFAWHPLAIIESGHSAHIESLGLVFLSLSLFWLMQKPLLSKFAISLAGLVKIWPISFLALTKLNLKQTLFAFSALFFFLIPSAIFWIHAGHTKGLITYIQSWEFHSSIFSLLKNLFSSTLSRTLCTMGFFLSMSFFTFRFQKQSEKSFIYLGLFLTGAFLLFSPTVHPWYSLWLLPFLVFHFRWEWLYLSLSIITAYEVLPLYLEEDIWKEALWPRWVTYTPVFLSLFWRMLKVRLF